MAFDSPGNAGFGEGATQPALCDASLLSPLLQSLDGAQVKEIIDLCIADAKEKTDSIYHAADIKDWAEVAVCAHDIKSTSGQVGAMKLRDIAIRLEANCRNEGGDDAHHLVGELERVATETFEAYSPGAINALLRRARV